VGVIHATRGRGTRSLALLTTGAFVALLVILLALAPWTAHADSTVTVGGQCTLPLAVAYADGAAEPACAPVTASGTTTITLPAGTYTLSATLPLTANTVIAGAGASSTVITAGDSAQVLSVAANVTAALTGVTITGGLSGDETTGCTGSGGSRTCPAEDGIDGGGIANAGTLTLTGVVVSGNAASPGVLPTPFFCPVINCQPRSGESAGDGGNGGGIYNTGTLILDASTVSGNAAGDGGDATNGVSGTGTDDSAGQEGGSGGDGGIGGGIDNASGATLTVSDSTIAGNSSGAGGNAGSGSAASEANGSGGNAGSAGLGGSGGGIADRGTLTITASTILSNVAGTGGSGGHGGTGLGAGISGIPGVGGGAGFGGGVFAESPGTTLLTNVTISGNRAPTGGVGGAGAGTGSNGVGGGIWHSDSLMQLSFDTVAGNSAAGSGGGVDSSSGSVTEADSIIASNSGSPAANCSVGGVVDEGGNVVFGDNSCPGMNGDPKLGSVQDNGGPTQTLALLPGSAAIDTVALNSCPVNVDQRGVSRPQGAGCDAGAYERASPGISAASGVGTSPTAATVTASINPNGSHADTSVTVEYGLTTGYGTTSPAQDVGRAVTPVPFSASLAGLLPSATYHFAIVATNADGTTTTSDGTFTTAAPPPLSAAITSAKSTGSALRVDIVCSGGAPGSVCTGPLTLSAHVPARKKKMAAVVHAAKSKPRPKPKTETVGSGTYTVATGTSTTVTVMLNSKGRKLLAAHYRLAATLTVGGPSPSTRTLTFKYAVVASPISVSWSHGPHSTNAERLVVDSVPAGSKVLITCHGGGCPLAKRSFAVKKKGTVSLTSLFTHHGLRPRAVVELEITHAGEVGKVALFTIRAGAPPSVTESCLVPGARRPTACVH
jgi:hypothetical protein